MKEIELPPIGQTLSRESMPQIDDPSEFISSLGKEGVSSNKLNCPTDSLKSTQSNFDKDKIAQIMLNKKGKTKPIIVSRDDHILDGHHRWIADHNTTGISVAYKVDLPILELVKKAHDYNNNLKEEITHKDLGPMLDSFVSFASKRLGIKSLPNIETKADSEYSSFASYNPSEKKIQVVTKNRHPMDIFRSLAHELVHCKQDEDGRIKDVAKEGETGSDIENEANSMAGQIMRWYAKANPDKFSLSHMVEETMDEACWKGYHQPEGKKLKPKKGKPGQFVPNCVPNKVDEEFEKKFGKLYDGLRKQVDENLPCNREEGTDSVVWNYASHTPGQEKFLESIVRVVKKKKKDATPDVPITVPGEGLGPTMKTSNIPAVVGGYTMAENCGKRKKKTLAELMSEPAEMGTVPSQGQESLDDVKPSMNTLPKIKIRRKKIAENIDKESMECNKPRAQAHGSGETGKSHVVKACSGGKEKLIRFGQLGVKGSPKKEGESEEYANRRKRFKARHSANIKKGKMSAAYWANKVKW